MNLRQKLEPTIQDFIKGLDSIEHQFIEKNKEMDVQIKITVDKNYELEQLKKELNKDHEAQKENLKQEVEKSRALQTELQKEINKVKTEQGDFACLNRKVENTLKNAEAERKVAEDNRRNLDKAIKKYNDKSNALLADFTNLDARKKQVINDEAKIKAKEKDLLRREEKVITDNAGISVREIDLKAKFKTLELEKKRANV